VLAVLVVVGLVVKLWLALLALALGGCRQFGRAARSW